MRAPKRGNPDRVNATQGRIAALLAVAIVTAGCARWMNRDVETCGKFAAGSWQPYDSTMARRLAGTFRLIMISENQSNFSHSTSTTLHVGTVVPRVQFGRDSVTLTVERVARDGFSGLYEGDQKSVHGRFCALRR